MKIIYPVSEGFDFRRARFHQILQTVHALARQGCEVDFLIGKNKINIFQEALPYFGLDRHQNLRVHEIPMLRTEENRFIRFSWGGVYLANCLCKIRRLIQDREYHAVYVRHLDLANFLLSWQRIIRLPVVFEAHEIFYTTTERKNKERRIRRQEMRLYKRVNGIVAITRGLAAKIREKFGIGIPMEVIPDGVNLDFFQPTAPPLRRRSILYVGQLYPWKGIGVLIEAMQHLPGEELQVVGGGVESMQRWRQRAGELKVQDRIIFQGQVTPQKVREFLHEGTVGVLPLTKDLISASFTSPLKLFEYMAAGIPIVASDLPSMREILNPGINAVLVKPDDPEALALGIRALLADRKLADQLSRQASADAAQYSWMNRGKRIISFLRTVKGESGTSWS